MRAPTKDGKDGADALFAVADPEDFCERVANVLVAERSVQPDYHVGDCLVDVLFWVHCCGDVVAEVMVDTRQHRELADDDRDLVADIDVILRDHVADSVLEEDASSGFVTSSRTSPPKMMVRVSHSTASLSSLPRMAAAAAAIAIFLFFCCTRPARRREMNHFLASSVLFILQMSAKVVWFYQKLVETRVCDKAAGQTARHAGLLGVRNQRVCLANLQRGQTRL